MTYRIGLRKKVIEFLNRGGTKTEASEVFGISRRTIHYWLKREDLNPKLSYPKYHKIDKGELLSYIRAHPDSLLRELSKHFKLGVSGISYTLKTLGINKKNSKVCRNKSQKKS